MGARQAISWRPLPLARHLPHEHRRRGRSALDLPRRSPAPRRRRDGGGGPRGGHAGSRGTSDAEARSLGSPGRRTRPLRRGRGGSRPSTRKCRWHRPPPSARPRCGAARRRWQRTATSRSPLRTAPGEHAQGNDSGVHEEGVPAAPRSEFYSSGFLTENQNLPWAKVIGPTTPSQIGSTVDQRRDALRDHRHRGAARRDLPDRRYAAPARSAAPEWGSYGEVILPTGLARVTDTVRAATWPAWWRCMARSAPASRRCRRRSSRSAGAAHAVPVSDGVRGKFLGGPNRQDLKAPQMVVFIDKGRDGRRRRGRHVRDPAQGRAPRRAVAAHQRAARDAADRPRP